MEPGGEIDATITRFAHLLAEGAPLLDEAMLLIAAAHRPGLDLAAHLAVLDELAASCDEATLEGVARHLFQGARAFVGNAGHYDDPDNSLLDQVLERRLGIPISLSVVAIEVGRRVGVELVGIGMPAHFLVRTADPPADGGPAFLDPFHGGVRRSAVQCQDLFTQLTGGGTPWDPRFLAPVANRAVLARVLTNLKLHHVRAGRTEDLRTVMRLRACFAELERGEREEFARLMAPTN